MALRWRYVGQLGAQDGQLGTILGGILDEFLDAQKKYNDEFNSATKNLLGFDANKIRSALTLGMKEKSIVPSIEKLISTNQD